MRSRGFSRAGTAAAVSAVLGILLAVFLGTTGCRREDRSGAEGSAGEAEEIQRRLYREVDISSDLGSYEIEYFSRSEMPQVAAPIRETDEPFQIVDYGPSDELPAEVEYPSVYVVFSQPVVPISRLGRPLRSSEIMEIDPPIEGVFRWYGTRLLSFDAEGRAVPQQIYRVSVDESVTSLGGKKLVGDTVFSFRTEYLSVRDFVVGPLNDPAPDTADVPPGKAEEAVLIFSYPVNLDFISGYISVDAAGRGIPFTAQRPEDAVGLYTPEQLDRMVRIRLQETPPTDTEVTVTVRKGARSEPDYIGIPDPIALSYHTLRPFDLRDFDTYSWSFPRSPKGDSKPVYFTFSHPVAEESLAGKIHTMPEVEVGPDNIEVRDNTVKLNGLAVEHEKRYLFFFDGGIEDVYGRSLGSRTEVAVTIPPAERYSYFPDTGSRMLEASFPPRIVWEYQNVFEGVWRAGPIDDPYESFPSGSLEPFDFSGKERNVRYFEVYDFGKWLNDAGKGWVGFSWNFSQKNRSGERPEWARRDLQLQVTDLGLTVRHSYNRIIVWVTSLSTGRPVEGAEVSIMRKQAVKGSRLTDGRGIAVFDLEPGQYRRYFGNPDRPWEDFTRLRASKGADVVEYKPNSSHNVWRSNVWNTVYPTRADSTRMETFLFSDRGLYKPGEKVSFRGIDRDLTAGNYSIYRGGYSVTARESRYEGREIASFQGSTTAQGGFFGGFTVPEDAEPGYYEIAYSREGRTQRTSFQVAHFRRTGFSVSAEFEKETYLLGDELTASVTAEYLSGGRVNNGTYEMYWSKEGAGFSPPGTEYDEYRFGPDEYGTRFSLGGEEGPLPPDGAITTSQRSLLDGIPGLPYRYLLEARVSDVSNQIRASEVSTLVHPASFYIGGRIGDSPGGWYTFLERGEESSCDLVLVDPEGAEVSGSSAPDEIEAELYRVTWKLARQQGVAGRINSRWERTDELEYSTAVDPGGGRVEFTPARSGRYYLRLTAADDTGRTAVTDVPFYSTGAEWVRWGGLDENQIELKPDKRIYEPGETAGILVQTPLSEGDYLLTVEREGIISEEIISIEGSSRLIEIPVRAEYLPVVYVSLCSYTVRTGEPDHDYFTPDLDKPKGLFGITPLRVEIDSKVLDVAIEPSSPRFEPGGEAEVTLTVRENGEPVSGAEVAFLAADRGVLDLIDYHVPDPSQFFYSEGKFPLGVGGGDSRSLLIDPVTYEVTDLLGGGGGDGKAMAEAEPGGGLQERTDFRATAVFEPVLTTGEEGKVTVRFALPDTLTTYRCTAVAVKDDTFGIAEEEIQVRNPINIKTAFPRRMRVRDTGIGSVLLTNLTGDRQECEVTLSAEVIRIGKTAGKTVTLPPDATIEVPFELQAVRPGEAVVTVTTASEVHSERLTVTFPVEMPRVYESFTAAGVAEDTAEEGLAVPELAEAGEGSLDLTLAGSRIASLGEAVRYLVGYPYGCMEQRASRLLPLVVFADEAEAFLRPVLEELRAEDLEPRVLVREELEAWAGFQKSDGGFPFWPDSGAALSSYYVTVRAAHLLYLAEREGFSIPGGIDVPRMIRYLENPPEWARGSDYLMLYGIYVRALFGGRVGTEADRYLARGDRVGLSGYGFLGLIYHQLGQSGKARDALARMKQFIRPGTRTVDITETYEAGGMFYDSQVEQLALYLLNQLESDPDDAMVTRLVNTLLTRQRSGTWRNTADTNWAVLALSGTRDYENPRIDFTARAEAAGVTLVEEPLTGPTDIVRARASFENELKDIPRDKIVPLTITAADGGTLYYTATLRYSLPAEIIFPRDEGIGIHVEYFDTRGNRVEGTELVAGKTYRVEVYVSTTRTRNFLALRVPIPSRSEELDASFATTPGYDEIPDGGERNGDRSETFAGIYRSYAARIYDNEVRFFWDTFPKGRQRADFLIRTTSAGVYPTPPATGECMYEPEIFGRTGGRLVIIKREE